MERNQWFGQPGFIAHDTRIDLHLVRVCDWFLSFFVHLFLSFTTQNMKKNPSLFHLFFYLSRFIWIFSWHAKHLSFSFPDKMFSSLFLMQNLQLFVQPFFVWIAYLHHLLLLIMNIYDSVVCFSWFPIHDLSSCFVFALMFDLLAAVNSVSCVISRGVFSFYYILSPPIFLFLLFPPLIWLPCCCWWESLPVW